MLARLRFRSIIGIATGAVALDIASLLLGAQSADRYFYWASLSNPGDYDADPPAFTVARFQMPDGQFVRFRERLDQENLMAPQWRAFFDAKKNGRPYQWTLYFQYKRGFPFLWLTYEETTRGKLGTNGNATSQQLDTYPRLSVVHVAGWELIGDTACYTGLSWLAMRCISRRRAHLRMRRGLCPACTYDLTGNVSGICPECGTSITEKQRALSSQPPESQPGVAGESVAVKRNE